MRLIFATLVAATLCGVEHRSEACWTEIPDHYLKTGGMPVARYGEISVTAVPSYPSVYVRPRGPRRVDGPTFSLLNGTLVPVRRVEQVDVVNAWGYRTAMWRVELDVRAGIVLVGDGLFSEIEILLVSPAVVPRTRSVTQAADGLLRVDTDAAVLRVDEADGTSRNVLADSARLAGKILVVAIYPDGTEEVIYRYHTPT